MQIVNFSGSNWVSGSWVVPPGSWDVGIVDVAGFSNGVVVVDAAGVLVRHDANSDVLAFWANAGFMWGLGTLAVLLVVRWGRRYFVGSSPVFD